MSKLTLPIFLIFTTLLFFTCTKKPDSCNENLDAVKGLNFYPLEVGKYISYQLDSIIYKTPLCDCGMDPNCGYPFPKDTLSWQLKVEVVDDLGDGNFVIERFLRKSSNDPWQIKDVWSAKITDTHIEQVEENLRFIKMVFPVTNTALWDGNTFFQDTSVVIGSNVIEFYQHWSSNYKYANIDEPEEINGITFDSVVTVLQSDQRDNKVAHRVAIEKYARGIGLIYKEMLILDSDCCIDPNSLVPCTDIPWEGKGEKGLVLRQSVIDYN